jgi:N-acetylmuramoyl-L-alanine amidase
MSIVGDFIQGIDRINLVHQGMNQTPKLLVIHYSVTSTVEQAVAVLNRRRLSYHILIEKNGKAFQTRPFTKTAAHPGLSNWKAMSDVNFGMSVARGAIGICLVNLGFDVAGLQPTSIGAGKLIYNPDDRTMQRWEKFPAPQAASCKAIARDIIATYQIDDVVGHHDVAIMGKFDPGPLFNLDELKAFITSPRRLGFPTEVRSGDGFLNLRRGRSTSAPIIRELPNGTALHIRSIAYGSKSLSIDPTTANRARYLTRWASVDVDGTDSHAGFVHMSGLAATPLVPALAARL